jgi:hypothetical protein
VLELVTDGTIEVPFAPAFHRRDLPIPTREVARPFMACTACEYCEQIIPAHHLDHDVVRNLDS